MSNSLGSNSFANATLPIILASLAAAVAAFLGSASAVAPAGDPDFAAGYVVGTGLAFGFVAALAAYFLFVRKLRKGRKRYAILTMLAGMTIGAVGGSMI